jgi:hypothetical protein
LAVRPQVSVYCTAVDRLLRDLHRMSVGDRVRGVEGRLLGWNDGL